MSLPSLPAYGTPNWYPFMQGLHAHVSHAGVVRAESWDSLAGQAGHDSTAALQSAIAASEETGGTVVLARDAVYEISSSLVMNSASSRPVRILGNRTAWIVAKSGFTGVSMLNQSASSGMVEDPALLDLNLDGGLNVQRCVTMHYAHRLLVDGGWWKNVTDRVAHFGGTHVYECTIARTRLSGIQPTPSQTPAQMPPYGLYWDANDSALSDLVVVNAQELVNINRGGNVLYGLHLFGYPYKTASESRDFLATTGVRLGGQSNTLVGTYLDTQRLGILVTGTDVSVTDTRALLPTDWTPSLSAPVRVVDVANDAGASGRIAGITASGIPAGVTTGGTLCNLRAANLGTVEVSGANPNQSGAGGRWESAAPGSMPIYVASRGGDSLLSNGSASMRTNYNFSSFSLITSDHASGCNGSFQSTSTAAVFSDELIAITPTRYYDLTYSIRQHAGDGARRHYGFLAPFDADGLAISPGTYMEQTGTRTTLAAPLNVGATSVTLTSSANWNNAAGASTHLRTIIFWSWTDAGGYTWPAGTYSRLLRSNAYADGGISGNTITLSSPWGGPALPAGTSVSNGSSGSAYMYGDQNILTPTSWSARGPFRFGGTHTDLTAAATTAFPAATAAVKVGFLLNQGTADPTAIARVSALALRPVPQKLTVSGSRAGNAALASLLTALAQQGVITDSTTA